jgi:hypothetical protein
MGLLPFCNDLNAVFPRQARKKLLIVKDDIQE